MNRLVTSSELHGDQAVEREQLLPIVRQWVRSQLLESVERRGVKHTHYELAGRHKVVWELSDILLADEEHARFHDAAAGNQAFIQRHQSLLAGERDRLREAFDTHGMRYAFLKGSAYALLGIQFEGRECADIDILFQSEDHYVKALSTLSGDGYVPVSTIRYCQDDKVTCSSVEFRREQEEISIQIGCYLNWIPSHPSDLLSANLKVEKDLFQTDNESRQPALSPEAMILNLLHEITANCYLRMRDLLDWAMLVDAFQGGLKLQRLNRILLQQELHYLVAAMEERVGRRSAILTDEAWEERKFLGRRLATRFCVQLRPRRVWIGMPIMDYMLYRRTLKSRGFLPAVTFLLRNLVRACLWRGLRLSGPKLRSAGWRRLFLQGRKSQTIDLDLSGYLSHWENKEGARTSR